MLLHSRWGYTAGQVSELEPGLERLNPAEQSVLLAGHPDRRERPLDEFRRSLKVTSGRCVADGLGPFALALVPLTGPSVQLWSTLGFLVFEMRLQDVGEQVVIAIPTTLVVERNDEEVAPFQDAQHRLAVAPPGDGIAERAIQPVKDAGVQEEHPDLVG